MGKQEVSWLAIDKTVVADAASVGSDAGSIRHLSSGSNHGYLCV